MHHFGTGDASQNVICLSFSQAPFLLSCYLTCIWTCKTDHFSDKQLIAGSFLPAITFSEVIDKSQGDLSSSNGNYFPLRPLQPITVARLFFEVSTSIFCQSFHTLCFRIFAAPVKWSVLEIALQVLRPSQLVSIVQSFLKASSSRSRVPIRINSIAQNHLLSKP